MSTKQLFGIIICNLFILSVTNSQPWKTPLSIATSNDGTTFLNSKIFQDSSGVPSVINWKGDTLICAFQWFRKPEGSLSWDRVAVKYSYDNGKTWTVPSPIIIDLPGSYQRPFDPALAVINKDSLRMYFSSSNKLPVGGLDSLVNTYSAVSTDGLHFHFEPNPRVDVADKPVIDPTVLFFNNGWHYIAPAGAPQEGAHHYVSPDGINFSAVPKIPSDNAHNWTGNLMVNNDEMRFYGSGQNVWYNATANGGVWKGFNNTNIKGGDPSVVQLKDGSYIMIYVGQPNVTGTNSIVDNDNYFVFPNPAKSVLCLNPDQQLKKGYILFTSSGDIVRKGVLSDNYSIDLNGLPDGLYFLQVGSKNDTVRTIKFIIER